MELSKFIFIVIINYLFGFTSNQRCNPGFFWCGGKNCYNQTIFDGCCADEGLNSKLYECCAGSIYYAHTCEKPLKCCSKNNYCYLESKQTCCNDQFVCSLETQQCCEETCCKKEESCCRNKCCQYGYKCKLSYYSSECVLTYDYTLFFIPIIVNIAGFMLIVVFIKNKFCSSKLKKAGIINERTFKEKLNNHTQSETVRELNPQRFLDEINERHIRFTSKIEFEKFALGYIHKTFYKSSICSFIGISLPIYFSIMIREIKIFSLLFLLLQIMRLFHLYMVLQGKVIRNIKCTQVNCFIYILGWIIGFIIYIFYEDR